MDDKQDFNRFLQALSKKSAVAPESVQKVFDAIIRLHIDDINKFGKVYIKGLGTLRRRPANSVLGKYECILSITETGNICLTPDPEILYSKIFKASPSLN